MPVVVNPGTPLAKRAVPVVKLAQEVCLRCSKKIGDGGENCVKKPNTKCEYCRRLKKECAVVPPEFRKIVNQLFRLLNSRNEGEEQDGSGEDDALEQARRSYIKDVEAFLRQEVKHGLTKRPKGDEIQLLQVQAINRLAKAAEGILDVLRFQSGIAPLGDADAPSDNEDQNPQVVPDENESEEREQEGNEEGNEETLSQEFNRFFGDGEGADPPESPTAARDARAKRRRDEGPDNTEEPKEAQKKNKKKKKGAAGAEGDTEVPETQTTVISQEGGEVPVDPPAAVTTQPPRPRVEGLGPNVEADKSKFDKRKGGMLFGKDGKPKMTLQEFLGSKGGKTPTLRLPSTIEQGKRRRVEGASSESSSPKKRRAHKDDRIQKRQEKKKARARPVVEPEEEA